MPTPLIALVGLRANESALSWAPAEVFSMLSKSGGIIPIVAFELESCGQAGILRVTRLECRPSSDFVQRQGGNAKRT